MTYSGEIRNTNLNFMQICVIRIETIDWNKW